MGKRTEKQDNSIYDDIVYTYKVMDDAPYELDDVKLRSMQKMERALHFILNNIKADSISVKETAKQAGYSEAYFIKAFKMYFGMPFQKYIDKLKLRKAASEIQQRNYPKQISSEYGYSSVQSFSKAFKREIGISPRYFFTRSYTIPDMPFRNDVMGVNISLEYREEKALSVSGVSYLPPRGEDTYFMDSYALPFAISKTVAADEQADDKVGIWWYGLNEGMKYVYGSVKKYYDSVYVSSQNASDNEIVIQGGNYAVFSYPRPEDARKIHLFSRIMARFIFKEWVPVNEKVTNTIGYTYEKFTKTRVYIYLPLATGMGGTEYDALAQYEGAQDNISNYAKLVAAEEAIANLIKGEADPVKDTISSLPKASDLTLNDKAAVEAARASYDALSSEAKEYVENITTLELAEATIAKLEAQAELAQAKDALNQALENAEPEEDIDKLTDQVKQAKEDLKEANEELTVAKETVKIQKVVIKKIKAKAQKKKATVSWKSAGKGYQYEVYKSTKISKGFKKASTTKKVKAVVKKLKSKKTYYIKVRAFKTVNGKKVYTQYSDTVKVKVK